MTHLLPKKFIKQSRFINLLSRYQPYDFVQSHGYAHDVTVNEEGPVAILKYKVARGELTGDQHQMKVAETLQCMYEELNGYKPEQFNILDKWLGKKRKQPPKGLYLYGAVGGGKTMLMDLFYQCCKVSRRAFVSVLQMESQNVHLLQIYNRSYVERFTFLE